MKSYFVITFTLLTLILKCYGQNLDPTSFTWQTDVSTSITKQQSYDMHANELGINIVHDASGSM